jgi:hypothetical protein
METIETPSKPIEPKKDLDFWESDYFLNEAKKAAKKRKYNPNNLYLSDNDINKLMYIHKGKKIYFGRKGYGDFIYYNSPTFKNLDVFRNKANYEKYAKRKRYVFRKSHNAMTEKFKLDKYSANELALKILW